MLSKESASKLANDLLNTIVDDHGIETLAVQGFFRGIAEGHITTGQSWPIELILKSKIGFEKADPNLIRSVFASGFLCNNQEFVEKSIAQFRRG